MSSIKVVEPVPMQPKATYPVRVATAYLQTGVTVPGHTTAETNLSPQKFPALRMTLISEHLLQVDFGGKGGLALVPTANVKVMLLG